MKLLQSEPVLCFALLSAFYHKYDLLRNTAVEIFLRDTSKEFRAAQSNQIRSDCLSYFSTRISINKYPSEAHRWSTHIPHHWRAYAAEQRRVLRFDGY